MDVKYKPKYSRDVRKIKSDSELSWALAAVLYNIRSAKNKGQINNLKKLDEYEVFYRIKIKLSHKKDYRLGIMIKGNKVWLLRFLKRRKIYEEFP
ncbi:MAG: type II toxin-antitoxin system RelE/ParE family toxin [Bacteroidetes bacterium]|nr:type II toxin-antitoxin system RelE/ParE family toxin [Bacteroidota bacterium]